MKNPSSSSSNKTVRFNVGGKIYEVALSLLEQHPDTMLARIASDTWSQKGVGEGDEDEAKKVDSGGNESEENMIDVAESGDNKAPGEGKSEALFIERDGERFRYCLDYMRDGAVHLPPTIPKDALLQDLTYYGFQDIDPSKISVIGSIPIVRTCHDNINSHISLYQEEVRIFHDNINSHISDFTKEFNEIEKKRKCLLLAKYCLTEHKQNGSLWITVSSNGIDLELYKVLNEAINKVFYNATYQRQFDEYLKRVGLKYDNKKAKNYGGMFLKYLE